MKTLLKLSSIGLLLCLSLTTISAATYRYGSMIDSNGQSMSAYTFASEDNCSVSSQTWYLDKTGKNVYSKSSYALQDPYTKTAQVAVTTASLNASLITKVESKHTVGSNIYYSSDQHPYRWLAIILN